jgi:DNA-binding transcriptional ArsR family regulator
MSDVQPVQRDYDLADSLAIDDAVRLKALGDPLRLHICDLVLERAMSVSELAERVDRPRGSVAYHVDVLVDAGLLHVVRTRKVRATEERFYGRAARTFMYTGTADTGGFLDQVIAEIDYDRLAAAADDDDISDGRWGGSTYRHARIPHDRVREYMQRIYDLALEFVDEPRSGDVEFGMLLAVFPTNRPTRHLA